MEIGLREWLIIGGILVILLIILDGWRRMKGARNNQLRLDIDKDLPEASSDEDYNPELPNGGARVSSQPQPLFEHVEPRFDTDIELDEPALAERQPPLTQPVAKRPAPRAADPDPTDPERVPLITELADPRPQPEPVPVRPAVAEPVELSSPNIPGSRVDETPVAPNTPDQPPAAAEPSLAEARERPPQPATRAADPLLAPLPDQPLPAASDSREAPPILADERRPLGDDPLMDLDKPITELLSPQHAEPPHSQTELALEPAAEPASRPAVAPSRPAAQPEPAPPEAADPVDSVDDKAASSAAEVDFRAEAEQQLDQAAGIDLEPPTVADERARTSRHAEPRHAEPAVPEDAESPDAVAGSARPATPARAAQPPELSEGFDPNGPETDAARSALDRARVKGGTLRKEPDPANVLVVSVLAKSPEGFSGQALLQLVLACGMRFGDMDIFHRFEDGIDRGAVQFSMANAVGSGTFDIDRMAQERTPAVSFFMSMEEPREVMNAFNCMLATAETVARYLDGELVDENRSVMRSQTQEHYRQRVRDFEMHNMRRRNL